MISASSVVSPYSFCLDTPLPLEHVALRLKLKHFNTDFHHLLQKNSACNPISIKQINTELLEQNSIRHGLK